MICLRSCLLATSLAWLFVPIQFHQIAHITHHTSHIIQYQSHQSTFLLANNNIFILPFAEQGVVGAGAVAFGLIASGEKRPSGSSTRTTSNNSIKQDVVKKDASNQRAVEDSIEVHKVKKAHISSENNVSSSVSSSNIVDKAILEKKDKLVPPVVGTEVQPQTRTIAKVDEPLGAVLPNQLVDSNQPGVKTAPLGVIAIVALTALRSGLINAKAGREELQRKERMEKFQLDINRTISRAQEAASEARDELAELKDDGTT